MREPKRIAVFRMGHLGDTIVALPALWTVRKRFPKAKILFLTQEHNHGAYVQGTEVLLPGTVFDEYLSYRLGAGGVSKLAILKTLIGLRLKRIDLLIYIPSYRTASQLKRDRLFFRLAGIKQIVGMSGYEKTNYRPEGSPLPEVAREADLLLRHIGEDGVSVPDNPHSLMHMGLTDEEKRFAKAWLAENKVDLSRPVIGVGPGSKMTSKLWPVERFVEVAQALDAEFAPTFILFGSKAEAEVCQMVVDAVGRGVNAAGALTVRQSAAVFEYCQMYIGNDTGTMHIAASSGVRCVALFSARDWRGRWYPYGPGHVIHREFVPCEGCMLEVCDKANLCLTNIGSSKVIASARKVLSEVLAERGSHGGSSRIGA